MVKAIFFGVARPFFAITILRVSMIWRGNGIPTGQTVSQALQERHRLCGFAIASSPWWNWVTTRPIAPV